MSKHTSAPRTARKRSTKVLASVVLVASAASVAGLGTFGAFTSTTAASESVANGYVEIALTQHADLGTTVPAVGLVPGDTVQRAVTLTRSARTEAFGSVKLTTTAGTANLLSSDVTNGLQLKVDQCSTAWTKVAGATNELTCSGTSTPVIASKSVIGSAVDMASAAATLNGAAAAVNLRVQLLLPATADNTFQGLANNITFTFDATQRAATFK